LQHRGALRRGCARMPASSACAADLAARAILYVGADIDSTAAAAPALAASGGGAASRCINAPYLARIYNGGARILYHRRNSARRRDSISA